MNHAKIISAIIAKEQGFVDHPSDRGGPTCWGITQAVAKAYGYLGDMRNLPISLAERIYEDRYITKPGFYLVASISEALAEEMIDTGVNMGPAIPGPFLQRLLNLMNQHGTRYADIFVDGKIGPVTLDALDKFARHRGPEGLVILTKAINSLQTVRYIDIAESNESQEDFIYGWLKNRT